MTTAVQENSYIPLERNSTDWKTITPWQVYCRVCIFKAEDRAAYPETSGIKIRPG